MLKTTVIYKWKYTDDGDIIKGKTLELDNLIKKYYTQKAEAAKIRSGIKWAEEGERSTRYFFELAKNREIIKCGIELKTQKVSINMT
jgi:hypothetical protein